MKVHFPTARFFLFAIVLSLTLALCFPAYATTIPAGGEAEEIKVPIRIEVPYAIAGAEFEFEYTSGLEFLFFEKSEAVQSASTTPVVHKNGKTYLGFYNASNDYAPQDGVLDVGYLVFRSSGEANQSVTVTEYQYVEVVDKDTVNSKIITIDEKISVPLADGAGLLIGEGNSWLQYLLWGGALLLAVAAAAVIYRRKKQAAPAESNPV